MTPDQIIFKLPLDPNTLALNSAWLALLMAAALLALRALLHKAGRGLGAWAAAWSCFMLAAVLPLFSGTGWAGLLLPAVAQMAAYVLLYAGIARCLECPVAYEDVAIAGLLGSTWLALAGWTGDGGALAMIGVASVEAWAFVAIARLARQAAEKTQHAVGVRLLLLGLAIDIALSLLMALVTANPSAMPGGQGGALSSAFALVHGSFIVLWVVALVIMINEKNLCEWVFLATHDALTGVMTRGAFIQEALTELVRARRNGRQPAFLLIDLDHFKRVNDTYGHGAGDKLLRAFARQVQAQVRPHDYFARYGGEEFVVMMPETTGEEAVNAAERIRQTAAGTPSASASLCCDYTVSIGVAAARADETLDNIIARADRSLYLAKQGGRNRVERASDEAADLPPPIRHPS